MSRKLCVVGLGYVGLPVAVSFGCGGWSVVGFDICVDRVESLRVGLDKTGEVGREALQKANIHFTIEEVFLGGCDFYIIAVPTPIDAENCPDLTALECAVRTVGKVLKRGDIVVVESTVYPGVTEGIVVPLLESMSGLRVGEDFGIGYSPERINPGDVGHCFESITKVVAAGDVGTLEVVSDVYGSVVKGGIYRAVSIRVAEAAKVIENTQRDLNIALMNELCRIFRGTGLDTYDVLETAATKWNFCRFTPGLVGGHCIGVDPYYLSHWARQNGHRTEIIVAGRRINRGMSGFIAEEMGRLLLQNIVPYSHTAMKVGVFGITFKANVPDTRNSQVVCVVRRLQDMGFCVQVHDPLADREEVRRNFGIGLCLLEEVCFVDGVILAVAHDYYRQKGWDIIRPFLTRNCLIVMDLMAVLERTQKPDNVILWRP